LDARRFELDRKDVSVGTTNEPRPSDDPSVSRPDSESEESCCVPVPEIV
jgi:hypothetical protein